MEAGWEGTLWADAIGSLRPWRSAKAAGRARRGTRPAGPTGPAALAGITAGDRDRGGRGGRDLVGDDRGGRQRLGPLPAGPTGCVAQPLYRPGHPASCDDDPAGVATAGPACVATAARRLVPDQDGGGRRPVRRAAVTEEQSGRRRHRGRWESGSKRAARADATDGRRGADRPVVAVAVDGKRCGARPSTTAGRCTCWPHWTMTLARCWRNAGSRPRATRSAGSGRCWGRST